MGARTGFDEEPTHCSFCSKPSSAVAKLVAGPGVYICDECVELSVSIVSEHLVENAPAGAGALWWNTLDDQQMLDHIPQVAKHIEQAEADLRAWVLELRRRGVTWTRIGAALGIARQSAWERFSGEE